MAAPMDLNVPFCKKELLAKKAVMAYKLGYEVIAINNCLPKLLNGAGKKKKDKETVQVLHPSDLKIDEKLLRSEIGMQKKPLRQLSRISTVLSEADQAHFLNTDKVQMYDLVAVQPTSDRTFHQACLDLNIDIISLDVTERISFKMRRQTISAAVERGIHFELMYSPAIRDQTLRRYLISMAETLTFFGKGKNVILTSGCEKPIDIRGPHDVANLGKILFLSENQAKSAITTNCRSLLYHSKISDRIFCKMEREEARRIAQSVLQIESIDSLPESDAWLLAKCKVDQIREPKTDEHKWKDKRNKLSSTVEVRTINEDSHDSDGEDSDVPKAKKIKTS